MTKGKKASRAQRIAGRPLGDMRAVVRLDAGAGFTLEEAREVFPRYDDAEVQRVLLDLVGAGLLVEDPVANRWRCTPEGREIQRSSRKRLTRAKAEQILAHLVSRAHDVNANDRYVMRVETMVVFGSFLGDNPMIGDVDVAVELRPKFEDPREQKEAEKAARQRAVGRPFIDFLSWPKTEVMRTLKARSPVLELHDIHTVKVVLQRDPLLRLGCFSARGSHRRPESRDNVSPLIHLGTALGSTRTPGLPSTCWPTRPGGAAPSSSSTATSARSSAAPLATGWWCGDGYA